MEKKYLKKLEMEVTDLIAAWPGMGMLAVIAVDHLQKELGAELVAEVYAPLNSISFKNGVMGSSRINNKLYAAKKHKLLICIGDSQPLTASEVYDLADSIIDVCKELGVKRIFTAAATLSRFEGTPKVFGIVTQQKLLSLLKKHNIPPATDEGRITGLNGVLLDTAHKAGIDGICLLGQISFMEVPQHRSASAVLKTLSSILDLSVDHSKLEEEAKKIDASIRKMVKPQVKRDVGKGLDYIG
jgi:proteasome assembly chaperone (PAC2) family protein